MKNVKDWMAILKKNSKCVFCDSENVYPVITPCPHKYTGELYIKANSKRGIMICCEDCGAVCSISAEVLEN